MTIACENASLLTHRDTHSGSLGSLSSLPSDTLTISDTHALTATDFASLSSLSLSLVKTRKIGPPEGVSNCSVRNESLSQLLFSCEGGDNGGLRQIFFLEVYNQETERLHANMSSVDVPEFFVQNLPSGSKFTLNVYAANSKGRSPVSSYTASTLSPPEKQTKSLFGECSKTSILQTVLPLLILPACSDF